MNESPDPPSNFDEEAYLCLNPDVAQAVESKQFSSGWEHAVLHGFMERKPGLTQEMIDEILLYRRRLEEDAAGESPPSELRVRVHGELDLASFRLKGNIIARNIEQQLIAHAVELCQNPLVLDFGCGCGRVIFHLKKRYLEWRMKGSDIDQETIQWCAQHLSDIADFKQNGIWPPLIYRPSTFDFVYAISVFTHLPEEMQFAWLEELARVTKSKGVLFLSVHDIGLLPDFVPRASHNDGFYYLAGATTPGLPEFYQTSYHRHDYIRSKWKRYFDIVSIVSKGVNGHQDLVICRSR